ncbi:MAG: Serine/threonine-protein kinase PknD [Planctomycetes bacterium]|nr:Serine/threonine-protein kinase PknD [Planctomycetota bacterium]
MPGRRMGSEQTTISASPPPPSGVRLFIRRLGWAGPLAGAVGVIALAAWVYISVREALREQVGAALAALADTQAAALRSVTPGDGAAVARIASAGTPGRTGETLVVDADSKLLAPSRHEGNLGRWPATTTGLRLADYGAIFDAAKSGSTAPAPGSCPLTLSAGHLAERRSGADLDGYRGMRGEPVVGAWRWIPEANAGVAVEMERSEAYAALGFLRTAFLVLGTIAAGSALIAVFSSRREATLLRKMRESELKLRTLGQYTLLHRIGEGGMGEVFLARHAMLRRPTAVKLLRPGVNSEQAIARFEREVQQTSRLTHPNTVQIYDFGRTPGGTFYYAMEYLVGVTLDRFVRDHGPLEEGRVIYILLQACASLHEAHELGLVHRDIKPDNIALCRAGGAFDVAKVLDFGLVVDRASGDATKLSQTGAMLGTPMYMPPEAFVRPDSVDARSDLYSLGAVAYFLLTGHPPFEAKTVMELFHAHTKEKPVPPSERTDRPIHPDIDAAVMACLEKDPERRPKSANALARELEWCQAADDWNRDKARYWWQENEAALEERYGLSTKAKLDPRGGEGTMEIRLDGR